MNFVFLYIAVFLVMAEYTSPCPGCGLGTYDLNSRTFSTHFRYCSKSKLKDPPTSTPTPSTSSENPSLHLTPQSERGLLESMWNTTSDAFEFTNVNNERWELNDSSPFSEGKFEESSNQNTLPSDDEVNTRKRKFPFTKDVSIPGNMAFQIELMDILQKHKTDMKLYDEIIILLDQYLTSGKLNPKNPNLSSRKAFMQKVETNFNTTGMKPKHVSVTLEDGTNATVSLFDIEMMILSLLTDESLMKDENLAPGYDIFTGEVSDDHPSNQNYGEVHTGDAWNAAKSRFCGTKGQYMPLGLIVFGDKTHTDLHGSLSVTPIIFSLTLFNSAARNNPSFWRPLAYIPNLSHGKGKADKTQSKEKTQNEHKCLALAFASLAEMNVSPGGLKAFVKGRPVYGRAWIHFFIGDTEGNNKWLGHYNGSGKLKRPYRDCCCSFGKMCATNPSCRYITLDDMRKAKRRKTKATTEAEKTRIFQLYSKHDIRNALTEKNIPLSDAVHGPYRMMPPELLHTSGSGLIMYMFSSLRSIFGSGKDGMDKRELLDKLHQRLSADIQRQSERDFPRGAARTGLIDGTKCQSNERRGNLFLLLCLAHTTAGKKALAPVWHKLGINQIEFCQFIKLYLSMEEWFHSDNPKAEVRGSRKLIGKVLRLLKKVFPRKAGNGHNLPKFHGMTKMQYYMCLFGSAMNFYGGPGESAHKYFVKAPGDNTQRRVREFARQIANRMYECMVFEIANEQVMKQNNDYERIPNSLPVDFEGEEEQTIGCHDFVGRYTLNIHHINNDGESGRSKIKWCHDNDARSKSGKYSLHSDLLRVVYSEAKKRNLDCHGTFEVMGYTRLKMYCDDDEFLFYAHPWYQGKKWHDWALVEYVEKDRDGNDCFVHYPSLILGFIQFPNDNEVSTVIRTSIKPLKWSDLKEDFISSFMLSDNFLKNYVIIPTSAIVKSLFVFDDYEGDHKRKFCSLPKRNWARYFGNKIKCDRVSDVPKSSVDSSVNKSDGEKLTNDDDDYYLSDKDADRSSFSSYSSANDNDLDDVDFDDDQHIDEDVNILNTNGPAIQLYQSELDDTSDSDLEDVDEDIDKRNQALELKEDRYWANHLSGESYMTDTSDGSISDDFDESTELVT
jgi:hypothetical protein